MAYMNQEQKAQLAPAIKDVFKRYGMKGSISVDNYSSLVVTIKSGKLDLIGEANRFNREYAERTGQRFYEVTGNYQANAYRPDQYADNTVGQFFRELTAAMRGNLWYDRSDIMTDYFDTAYYLHINVGRWNQPYVCTGRSLDGTVNGVAEENYTFA
jgi:hypothetical protein